MTTTIVGGRIMSVRRVVEEDFFTYTVLDMADYGLKFLERFVAPALGSKVVRHTSGHGDPEDYVLTARGFAHTDRVLRVYAHDYFDLASGYPYGLEAPEVKLWLLPEWGPSRRKTTGAVDRHLLDKIFMHFLNLVNRNAPKCSDTDDD